jgi:hypothetical protein
MIFLGATRVLLRTDSGEWARAREGLKLGELSVNVSVTTLVTIITV